MCLKLHADLYAWETVEESVEEFSWTGLGDELESGLEEGVRGRMSLPRQSQFGRKEALYYYAMDYYGEFEDSISHQPPYCM